MKKRIIAFIVIIHTFISVADKLDVIYSGLDTLSQYDYSYDFYKEMPCTTSSSEECYNHMTFHKFQSPNRYELIVTSGYGIPNGKMNFDSIKECPPDSLLIAEGDNHMDTIPPDSLNDYIGMTYLFRTREDPRRECMLKVKLKIIDFYFSQDSSELNMVFLYAANMGGLSDLSTSNMDTFDLETARIKQDISLKKGSAPLKNSVFKATGNRFIVPQEYIGKNYTAVIFDLHGRELGRKRIGESRVIDIAGEGVRSRGVRIVEIGKR